VPVELDPIRLVIAVLLVEAVVAVVTLLASARGARFTVLNALAGGRGTLRSRAARRFGLRPPVPVSLGVRDVVGRPWRALLTTLALALSVGAVVAGLSVEATLAREDVVEATASLAPVLRPDPAGLAPSIPEPVTAEDLGRAQVRPLVHGLNVALLLVAVVNLLVIAVLSVRERTRDLGVLKAVGLTPKQVASSLFAGHGLVGVAAALVGIPFGIGLFVGVYRLADGDPDVMRLASWWSLALLPFATAAAVALVSALPARRAANLRVVDALRYE
jgi:hypothetical protein